MVSLRSRLKTIKNNYLDFKLTKTVSSAKQLVKQNTCYNKQNFLVPRISLYTEFPLYFVFFFHTRVIPSTHTIPHLLYLYQINIWIPFLFIQNNNTLVFSNLVFFLYAQRVVLWYGVRPSVRPLANSCADNSSFII